MRVALVTNGLLFGGAERIVEALAVDLTARGDAVHVVATTRGGPIADALRARGIAVSILGITSPTDVRVALELSRILARFRPDVVHSHLLVADLVTALAHVRARKTPLVTTVHSAYVGLGKGRVALWRQVLRTFDRVLATSDAVRRTLPASLDVTVLRPSLAGDGPRLGRAEARARLGLPADGVVVLGIGRLAHVKGFDVLAAAVPRLATRGVTVAVIGGGDDADALARAGGLVLLGPRDDAAELVGAADVVVCPSRSEGLPQVPLEAMAAAVPVVATAVGGTPEVVVDGETGRLVPPEDPQALARAIDELAADPARARRIGAEGRARLDAEGLTRRAMVDRTRAVYADLVA
ncbi:glycosyltransferase [Myxococcota bacterium]|nr:glycosyltransferase [Myxococcota bacterium]